MTQSSPSSSEQVLRSSLVTGLGSGLEMVLRLIRTKAIALILGPVGLGLVSLFNAIAETIHGPATAGFGASGVQQVARQSAGHHTLQRDVFVVRSLLAGLAGLGALLLFLGRDAIAVLSFGDATRAGDVGLLAIVVLLAALGAGNTTILQGLRRIPSLALITITSAVISTIGTIVLISSYGERAVVPSLILTALTTAAVSCWHVRDLPFRPPPGAFRILWQDGQGLLALGGIFLVTHLLTVLTDYAIRLVVLQSLEIRGAGLYQAAWTLGGTYVGFVLSAMATDFYPRLSAAAADHRECNRLVNEQVEVGMLLAGPGVLACLTLAPWLVSLCYSGEFAPAVDLFRLVLVGMLLRVIAWPMGYILRAKRDGSAVLWTETAKNALHFGLSLVLIMRYGLPGAGTAFVLTYVACLGMMLVTSRSLTGFHLNAANLRLSAGYAGILALLFVILRATGNATFLVCGLAATVATAIHSTRRLTSLGALGLLPDRVQRVLGRLITSQGVTGQAGELSAGAAADLDPSSATSPIHPAPTPPASVSPAAAPLARELPVSTDRPRILVALASHGQRNLPHLRRIIAAYRSMPFDVEVAVLSEAPKDLGPDVRVLVGLPTRNPWSLPFAHHQLFTEEADRHDLFVYSEDDIAVSESNLRAFLRVTPHLRDDEIAGFMRIESDEQGRQSLPDVHGSYRWQPDSVRWRGGEVFAIFTNEHAAFYVLTQAQLKRALASGGFGLPPRSGRYDMLCTAATDPYTSCGMTKLVCVSDLDAFLVRHLSGRYVGKLGLARDAFQAQVDALLHIAQGNAVPSSPFPAALRGDGFGSHKVLYERNPEPALQAVPAEARTVLSIGCGAGAAEAALAERGATVTAIPVDPVVGASAAFRGTEIIPGDLNQSFRLLGKRRFDCILISGVLPLVEDPGQLLDRCAHLLAPGGTLAVISPHRHSLPGRCRAVLGLLRPGAGDEPQPENRDAMDHRWLSRALTRQNLALDPILWLSDRSSGEDSGAHSPTQLRLRRAVRLLGRLGSGRAFATTWIVRARVPAIGSPHGGISQASAR